MNTNKQTHIDMLVTRLVHAGSREAMARGLARSKRICLAHGHDWLEVLEAANEKLHRQAERKAKPAEKGGLAA